MKLLHIYTFVLILMAISYADTNLTIGSCQTFELLNSTNETICASIPNLGINITLNASDPNSSSYFNSTYNVSAYAVGNQTIINFIIVNNTTIQNITVQQCNATSAIMWANSTLVINNAAIACLANATTVYVNQTQNISICDFTANITPTTAQQRLQNITGLDILIDAIPYDYCHENRNEETTVSRVFRSDRSNNTFICTIPTPSIQIINQSVEKECPAPVECSVDNSTATQLSDCNIMLRESNNTVQNYIMQINESRAELVKMNNTLLLYSDATSAGIRAANATTQPWNDLFSVLVLGAGVAVAAWVYKVRTPLTASMMPPANTAEDVLRKKQFIEEYEKKKLGG